MEKEEYEKDLKRRQEEHLENVHRFSGNLSPLRQEIFIPHWQPCLHDQCSMCCGTGVKLDGSPCLHYISCRCPKCSPIYMSPPQFNTIGLKTNNNE